MNKKITDDLQVVVIGQDTYKKLSDIAKKENKSVVDVTSEALSKHIDEKNKIQESKEPRLLMEG